MIQAVKCSYEIVTVLLKGIAKLKGLLAMTLKYIVVILKGTIDCDTKRNCLLTLDSYQNRPFVLIACWVVYLLFQYVLQVLKDNIFWIGWLIFSGRL